MGKILTELGNTFIEGVREGFQQRDREIYDEGRNDQFVYDMQRFVASLQDSKMTKEKIMDILYEYFDISDRGIANQIIEDSQQWRKKTQVKQIK